MDMGIDAPILTKRTNKLHENQLALDSSVRPCILRFRRGFQLSYDFGEQDAITPLVSQPISRNDGPFISEMV